MQCGKLVFSVEWPEATLSRF